MPMCPSFYLRLVGNFLFLFWVGSLRSNFRSAELYKCQENVPHSPSFWSPNTMGKLYNISYINLAIVNDQENAPWSVE